MKLNILKLNVVIFMASILLVFFNCSRIPNNHHEQLTRIESLLEDFPDSALSEIEKIDTGRLEGKAEKAYYALLLTIALDKNYMSIDSTLIAGASVYYENTNQQKYKFLTQLYLGKYFASRNDLSKAMTSVLKASDNVLPNDSLWYARLLELRADLYHESYLFEREIATRNGALSIYQALGKKANVYYSKCDIACALNDNKDSYAAYKLIKDAEAEALDNADTLAYLSAKSISMPILSAQGLYKEVLSAFETLQDNSMRRPISPQDVYYAGIAFFEEGNLKASKECLEYVDAQQSVFPNHCYDSLRAALYRECGETADALSLYEELLAYQDTLMRNYLINSTLSAENDFSKEKAESSLKMISEKERNTYILGVVSLFLLVSVAFIYHKYTLSVKKKFYTATEQICLMSEEIKQKTEIIEAIEKEMGRLSSDNFSLRADHESALASISDNVVLQKLVGNVLKKYLGTIDALCKHSLLGDSPIELKILRTKVDETIREIRGEEALIEVVEIVDRCQSHIISKIKEKMPTVKQEDLSFIALNIAGLSVSTIAFVLKLTPQGVYSKRRRLYEKVLVGCGIDLRNLNLS